MAIHDTGNNTIIPCHNRFGIDVSDRIVVLENIFFFDVNLVMHLEDFAGGFSIRAQIELEALSLDIARDGGIRVVIAIKVDSIVDKAQDKSFVRR